MRILISIFFFLALSTQLLPLPEVGKVLWSQTTAEEEVTPQTLVSKLQPTFNRLWYLDFDDTVDQFNSKSNPSFIIVDEALIKCFHLEVLIQPPDLA
jgi:hypothetical protein